MPTPGAEALADIGRRMGGKGALRTCVVCARSVPSCAFRKHPGDVCNRCFGQRAVQQARAQSVARQETRTLIETPLPAIIDTRSELSALGMLRAQLLHRLWEQLPYAKFRDLSVGYGILTEKTLLWQQKPTQIVSYQGREEKIKQLNALVDEAKRRWKDIDLSPDASRTVTDEARAT